MRTCARTHRETEKGRETEIQRQAETDRHTHKHLKVKSLITKVITTYVDTQCLSFVPPTLVLQQESEEGKMLCPGTHHPLPMVGSLHDVIDVDQVSWFHKSKLLLSRTIPMTMRGHHAVITVLILKHYLETGSPKSLFLHL